MKYILFVLLSLLQITCQSQESKLINHIHIRYTGAKDKSNPPLCLHSNKYFSSLHRNFGYVPKDDTKFNGFDLVQCIYIDSICYSVAEKFIIDNAKNSKFSHISKAEKLRGVSYEVTVINNSSKILTSHINSYSNVSVYFRGLLNTMLKNQCDSETIRLLNLEINGRIQFFSH